LHQSIHDILEVISFHLPFYFFPGAADGSEPANMFLFIMCPHTNYFYYLDIIQYLVNKAMLQIDSSGKGSGQIT
jgi:hypothetical protein